MIERAQARAGGSEHRRGLIDRDHLRYEGGHGLRELTRATAKVAEPRRGVEEAEEREELGASAEELGAEPVPLRRGRGEEGLRACVTVGEHPRHAVRVTTRGGERLCLGAHGGPETPRSRVGALRIEAVAVGGPVLARTHPPRIGKHLEVATHRGLRELQHRAELTDGELLPLQHQEEPGADRVGECREAVVEGGSFHPYIRMKGCTRAPRRQRSTALGPRRSVTPARARARRCGPRAQGPRSSASRRG